MSKVETVCPYCKKATVVEKGSGVSAHGLNKVQCSHCSKRWEESLTEPGVFAKSAPVPSVELAALRVQIRAQMDELTKKINGLLERRSAATRPARFQPQGEETAAVLKFVAGMPSGLTLEPNAADLAEASRQESVFVTKTASGEAVARAELQKALANGKLVTSPNYVRADDELEKDAPARFRTVESVGPGVQLYHDKLGALNAKQASAAAAPAEHRPFQPGGETDLNKAHAAVNHALANGKRV